MLLFGCAAATEPPVASFSPSPEPSATPSPEPEPVAGSVVLGGTAWEVRDTDGEFMSSIAYTEPVDVTLAMLSEVFGSDYVATEIPVDNECGWTPAHVYTWGDQAITVKDRSGQTTDPPRVDIPWAIYAGVPQFNGVEISASGGLSVGEDATSLPTFGDPMLPDQLVLVEPYDESDSQIGLFVLHVDGIAANISAPARFGDYFC